MKASKKTTRRILTALFPAFLAFAAVNTPAPATAVPIPELGELDLKNNETLKSLREEVRRGIYVIKSGRALDELPELAFYRYRIRPGDTFWTVLARTSMDMDTLLTVNDLSSPLDVPKMKSIYIPNLRGIVVRGADREKISSAAARCRVDLAYVNRVNGGESLDKSYVFIPCGKISQLQRSLFLGTAFLNPLSNGRRSSGFGTRRNPFNGKSYEFHRGINLACPMKSSVRAARRGRVIHTGFEGGYGHLVVIQHEMGYRTYYGHLSGYNVKPGDTVEPGDLIAYSGNSGRTTGPHLHFEIRRGGTAVNPSLYLHR